MTCVRLMCFFLSTFRRILFSIEINNEKPQIVWPNCSWTVFSCSFSLSFTKRLINVHQILYAKLFLAPGIRRQSKFMIVFGHSILDNVQHRCGLNAMSRLFQQQQFNSFIKRCASFERLGVDSVCKLFQII